MARVETADRAAAGNSARAAISRYMGEGQGEPAEIGRGCLFRAARLQLAPLRLVASRLLAHDAA